MQHNKQRPGILLTRVLLSSVLFVAAGVADDGVVEINQAKALAGDVTPGDSEGFPVTISESGSYRLTGNLTLSDENTHGISVEADNVTIGLNGFAVIGPLTCGQNPGQDCTPAAPALGGDGISGSSANRVKVHGGTVVGAGGYGIRLGGMGQVIDVRVEYSGGIGIAVSSGIVRDCDVRRNKRDGIVAGSEAVIEGNFTTRNDEDGIRCGGRCVVRGNVSTVNGGDGIDSNSSSVVGNTAISNLEFGLRLGSRSGWGHNVLDFNDDDTAANQVSGSSPQTADNVCVGVPCP